MSVIRNKRHINRNSNLNEPLISLEVTNYSNYHSESEIGMNMNDPNSNTASGFLSPIQFWTANIYTKLLKVEMLRENGKIKKGIYLGSLDFIIEFVKTIIQSAKFVNILLILPCYLHFGPRSSSLLHRINNDKYFLEESSNGETV